MYVTAGIINFEIMKNSISNKLLKIMLLTSIVTTFTFESHAQLTNINNKTSQLLAPFLDFTLQKFTTPESSKYNTEEEGGYLDRGILIFEENLKVCKDILTGSGNMTNKKDSNITIDIKANCILSSDTIKSNTNKITSKKKKHRTFLNNPGNVKSRI